MIKKLKSASSAKIGKNFTKKRLEYGNSIDEISKKLFINIDYLIATTSRFRKGTVVSK